MKIQQVSLNKVKNYFLVYLFILQNFNMFSIYQKYFVVPEEVFIFQHIFSKNVVSTLHLVLIHQIRDMGTGRDYDVYLKLIIFMLSYFLFREFFISVYTEIFMSES